MLVVNTEKFQMMFLGCPSENVKLNLDGTTALLASDSVKLLGITLDKRLSFENHVSSLCKKASTNVICLNRIRSFINYSQAKSLFESYIVSSFSYAPIVWMFCSKTSMKSIEIVHKRAVRALCNNFVDSYDDLLAKHDIKTVHEIHLRYLLCEIYKTLHFNNPVFMQNLFRKKEAAYNLRTKNLLTIPKTRSVRFGTGTYTFRAALLWNSLPDIIKNAESLSCFKDKLSYLRLREICSCKICAV